MTLRYRGAVYEISVSNPRASAAASSAAEIDGEAQPVAEGQVRIRLRDGGAHTIRATLG